MLHTLKLFIAGLCLFLLACGHVLTPAELDTFGAQQFSGERSAVFGAAVNALVDQGYEIALMNAETGTIKTHRRFTGGTGTAIVYRLYLVRVQEVTPGTIKVRAEPRLFVNAKDISGDKVWDLDDEQENWTQLYKSLQDNLDSGLTSPQVAATATPIPQ